MDALGADRRGDGPAHRLIVGGVEISARLRDAEPLRGQVFAYGHIDEDEAILWQALAQREDECHRVGAALAVDFGMSAALFHPPFANARQQWAVGRPAHKI